MTFKEASMILSTALKLWDSLSYSDEGDFADCTEHRRQEYDNAHWVVEQLSHLDGDFGEERKQK